MLVGILSDTHGLVETIETVLGRYRDRGVELLIHCGDIDDAATVAAFDGWPVHFVFGNCDHDRRGIRSAIEQIGGSLHESFGHLKIDDVEIAWTHGDQAKLFHDLERADAFDYLFYGHTHVPEQHQKGRTLVVNPGALHRARVKSCLVLDIATKQLETITI